MKRALYFILFSCFIFSVAFTAASDKVNKVEQYQINKKQTYVNQDQAKTISEREMFENNLKIKSELNAVVNNGLEINQIDPEVLKRLIKEKEFYNNPDLHNTRDCIENYISDGWCDETNNNEECGYDGGDCCPGDCVDATYSCETYGGDCEDCMDPDSADFAVGGECFEADCEYYNQVTCFDGSCAASEEECPQTCEDQGLVTCSDGTCADTEEDCIPENNCPDGYVQDCVDEDCCSEGWIGDGFPDCEDQQWGCDLTCYDQDGGDCIDCSDYNQITCWDGSCADTTEDCPDASCADTDCGYYLSFGGYYCDQLESDFGFDCSVCAETGDCVYTCEFTGQYTCFDGSCADSPEDCAPVTCDDAPYPQWLGDGYCDSGNNFEGCYDQGDCCESTCVDASYTCGIVGFDCQDPEACENQEPSAGDGCCSDGEDCESADCADTFECLYPDCDTEYPQYLGNGSCESDFYGLNNEGCGYDDGDCCGSTNSNGSELCGGFSSTYCNCLDPEACENQEPSVGDGCCSGGEDCESEDCSDTFACMYPDCTGYYTGYVGDGNCQSEFYGINIESCGYDGGDCCVETAGDPPGSQGDCYYGDYGDGSYCDCMDPDYANFTTGDTCDDPIVAVEGTNSSDGHDEYFTFTVAEGGFLTLSTAGAGIDTYLYLYASCDNVGGAYVAYNDDWGSSQYGTCPNCTYTFESYIYVPVTAGEYVIMSSDVYNSAHTPFEFTVEFEVGVEGCTNPNANNYDEEANIDDGSCQYDDDLYFINCDGGSWQSEVFWEVTNVDDGSVAASGGAPYSDMSAIPPGDYYINATDSYGDGWNGNILTIEGNGLFFEYTLETGDAGTSDVFTIEAGCDPGDVNDDALVNVLDIVTMVNAIVSEDTSSILSCGDMNNDNYLNVLDIVTIVNLILDE